MHLPHPSGNAAIGTVWRSLARPGNATARQPRSWLRARSYATLCAFRDGGRLADLGGPARSNQNRARWMVSRGYLTRLGQGHYLTTRAGVLAMLEFEQRQSRARQPTKSNVLAS